jgi:hypothetical protein
MSIRSILLAALCGVLSLFADSQNPPSVPPQINGLTKEQQKVVDDLTKKAEDEKLGGKNDQAILDKYFGVGIFANVDFGGNNNRRTKSARVINGLVRIEEESNSQIGFLLEAHKFLSKPDDKGNFAHGPFVALVMTDNIGINTGILGYMFGFRQSQTTTTLNIGLGVSITPRAQILGDGIIPNQPLPTGETEVRYKNITKYGAAVTVSFGF